MLLLTRTRTDAVQRGLRAGRSLPGIAQLIERQFQSAIATARNLSRTAGIARLEVEAERAGASLGRVPLVNELARDAARARLYGANFARLWLEKANKAGLPSIGKAADAANAATQARLSTVAITESAESFNTGRDKTLRLATDVRLLKVWDATLDKRTCPICAGADGTIVFSHEAFPQGVPGSVHPRCRCVEVIIGRSERINRASPPPAPSSRVSGVVPKAKPVAPPAPAPAPSKITAAQARAMVDEIGVFNADYMREGMRSLDAARSHYLGKTAAEAERLATSPKFPPINIDIEIDKAGQRQIFLKDGRHRMTAAREAGAQNIRAQVRVFVETEDGWKQVKKTVGKVSLNGRR